MKKPIPGKPEIGAHFVSFNFLNSAIRPSMSRHHQTEGCGPIRGACY